MKALHLIAVVSWTIGMILMFLGIMIFMVQWAPYFLGG